MQASVRGGKVLVDRRPTHPDPPDLSHLSPPKNPSLSPSPPPAAIRILHQLLSAPSRPLPRSAGIADVTVSCL